MGRKFLGALPPFSGGGAGSPSNTMSPGPRPTSISSSILIYTAIWPQRIWTENWGAVPLWGGVAGSPSNTMWPGPRPICKPSFILIRQTVWPQYTNVTDRTDRQTDNGPIAYGEPFYKRSPKNYTRELIDKNQWQYEHSAYSCSPTCQHQTCDEAGHG